MLFMLVLSLLLSLLSFVVVFVCTTVVIWLCYFVLCHRLTTVIIGCWTMMMQIMA